MLAIMMLTGWIRNFFRRRLRPQPEPAAATGVVLLVALLLLGAVRGAATAEPNLPARLQALEESVPDPPADARQRDEWSTLQFLLRKMRYRLENYVPTFTAQASLVDDLQHARRIRDALDQGTMPPPVYGLREEAYPCDTDGSFQPFFRYLPEAAGDAETARPMIVHLHGYSPTLNIVDWCTLSPELLAFAEKEGWIVLAPFGRSNTDFQNIGELDVLRAIREMKRRYPVDPERIVLSGFSMGGMGVWTIGAHHTNTFAGLLSIAGRGDYFLWHDLCKTETPSYKRDLVDAEFGHALLDRLAHTPALSAHGSADWLIPVREGRHMAAAVQRVNPQATYLEIPGGSHWIADEVFGRPDVHEWLRARRRENPDTDWAYNTDLLPSPHGPVQRAFLSPFLFVCAAESANPEGSARLQRAAREWEDYAKAPPRTALEQDLGEDDKARYNLFLFGEPETSPMIRTVLEESPITIQTDQYQVGSRTFERKNHGLILVRPNPWNPGRMAVVHSGIRWGEGLPENHKYGLLPDYIVFSRNRDDDGSNTALCAGFFDENWQIDPERMHLLNPKKDENHEKDR